MKLKLLRLDCSIEIVPEAVTTLEIEDRKLFSRVVESLISEKGRYATEPYLLFDGNQAVQPRGGMRVINSLPVMPPPDRGLSVKLLKKIGTQLEVDSAAWIKLSTLFGEASEIIEEAANGLQGDYCLTKDWDIETYLKAFGFTVVPRDDCSLLDNCIHMLGLCADLEPEVPVAIVNAKSFFLPEELAILFDEAVFSGISLLLLESWKDERTYTLERKVAIDQHFLLEL
jgi:CRISPR-associated protein Csn2